jgi:ribosomal-protein-alanine N-acetyltransferase
MKLPNVIQTERLNIYPLDEKYIPEIYDNFTEEITTFMVPKSTGKIEDIETWAHSAIKKNHEGIDFQMAIVDKKDNFLGCGGLNNINTRTPEFGIWIKKSAHGHKYGREAMTAVKDWAEKNLDYDYLKYPCDRANIASCKIPQSMGGILEAEYPLETMHNTVLDCVEYRIYPKSK